MAILKSGILGGVSGRIGTVVGAGWKGIDVLRTYNGSPANPRTNAQVSNRDRFSSVTSMASNLLATVIKPCWDRFAVKMSGYNAFASVNKDVFTMEGDFLKDDLLITKGKMLKVSDPGYEITGRSVTLSWSDAIKDRYQQPTDLVFYAVISNEGEVLASGGGSVPRSATVIDNIQIPSGYTTANCSAYLGFMRVDGSIVSDSAICLT